MFKKIFISVLFEKKRILLSFMGVFIALLLYTGFQTVLLVSQTTKLAVPDVQMNGKLDADGVMRFKLFNSTTGLSDKMKELTQNKMKVYGVVCRNIYSVESLKAYQKINYWIYGVDDNFFENEIRNCLKEGRVPIKGKREVVLGSYAARYFKVKVGDRIDVPITLLQDFNTSSKSQYVVSGILNDNIDYFKGAVFLSKETFAANNPNSAEDENCLFIYFNNSKGIKSYENIMNANIDILNKYNIETVNYNYLQKQDSMKSLLVNYIMVLCISCLILFLLISYLMKGITKKIGLLKALGVSDLYITKVFIGGIGICMAVSFGIAIIGIQVINNLLNMQMSKFFGFNVKIYIVNSIVYLVILALALILFVLTYAIIKFKSAKISPRDAMLKVL